ncbi:MAG: Hint domain-containing protein [Proteobacteria bacterium]|nr:Hint domain-containing protein [Pseudomonadota bacterium]
MRFIFDRATVLMLTIGGFLLGSCSSGGNNCFPAGTKVQTPTGEVNIETIKIGDEVMGFDLAANKLIAVHVTRTYVHHSDKKLMRITLPDLPAIEVTPEHPLFSATRNEWVTAGSLSVGESLQQLSSENKVTPVGISAVDDHPNTADVYNFETDVTKNYFAGGVLAKYY